MTNPNPFYFLSGGSEMGELTQNFDWSATAIGQPDVWPVSLRNTVKMLLSSKFPMLLWWGEDLIQFYNDAYRLTLGTDGKHPLVGKKGKESWPETWDFVGPLIEGVLKTGEPVWFEDQLIPIHRNGRMEDVYWTFSYSPAYNDSGQINGVLVVCTETTEKVKAYKRLIKSEKRFNTLIQRAAIGIIVVSGEDYVVDIVNKAYCQLIDHNSSAILGKPLFDIIPEGKPHFKHSIDKVKKTGEPFYFNHRPYFITTNGIGKEGYVNIIYQPYREEDGIITGVMILCQDVTEQVIAHQKIAESELHFRSLVESAPFPIGLYTGKNMRILLANQAILNIWGKGDDVIGKEYATVLPELEDQEIFVQLDEVYNSGIPFHAKNQRVDIVTDNQLKTFYFNYSFNPLYNTEGQVYGVLNTAADVTDLNLAKLKIEQSEKNFRNIILQAPVAMCLLSGPLYEVEVANQYIIELWGTTANAVMHKPIFEALPEARGQGLEELLHNVYTNGISYTASELPLHLLRNGKMELVYVSFVYDPYLDNEGQVLGVLAIAIDVTQQVLSRLKIEEIVKERTAELELVNNNLKVSNAELAQFAYIASHDLQEPLRKVSIFSQMLSARIEDTVDDMSQNYLQKINSSSLRMLALIKDVLTFSEPIREADLFVPVDLNKIVEDTEIDYELLIQEKNALLLYDNLPIIEAIPLQMAQLFGNIIGNSLKFAKKEVPLVITISATTVPPDAVESHLDPSLSYIRIIIADNGIGFKQEYAHNIFNIFKRLNNRSQYEGNGIGLAICKKIVLNHSGDLHARDSSEDGAVFTITLPILHKHSTATEEL